jgi:hypothetical protein
LGAAGHGRFHSPHHRALASASAHIDGVSVCRMFKHATAGQPKPKYLSTDQGPLFRFQRWLANLGVLEIEQIKSVLLKTSA